jgi:hypothetical protein
MPVALNEADRLPIQNLVKDYSIEATPQQANRIDRFADLVAPGMRIYVPHTPHAEIRDIVGLATRLRREQMEPVPHLLRGASKACRSSMMSSRGSSATPASRKCW